MRVRGESVVLADDGSVDFIGGMTVCADGSPRAYAPEDSGLKALEYLSNAGEPGNWYGLVCNPHTGLPVVSKSGYYISPTAYRRLGFRYDDPEAYLDPEKEFFVVFPSPLRRLVKPVVLGCKVAVFDVKTGRSRICVAGDSGSSTHLGEASIAVAEFFGVDASPKHGGTDEKRFRYTFFPGVAADGYELIPV
jgi:hypothetical protein